MKQIFALTSAMLAVEFTEQYSEQSLLDTLSIVSLKTGVKFDKVEETYKLTGQWLSILEAYDTLLNILLTENVSNIQDTSDFDTIHDGNETLALRQECDLEEKQMFDNRCIEGLTGHQVQLEYPLENTPAERIAYHDTDIEKIKVEQDYTELADEDINRSQQFLDKPNETEKAKIEIECDMVNCDGNTEEKTKRMSSQSKLLIKENKGVEENDKVISRRRKQTLHQVKLTAKKKIGRKKKIRDPDEVFKCLSCSYVGKTLSHFNNHMKRLHDVGNRFKCNHCNKSYGMKADLNRHMKTAHETPLFTCDKCNKSYKSKNGYEYHMRSHQKDYVKPLFKCTVCEKTYRTKLGLDYHFKGEHLGGLKHTYLCSICGKTFTNKAACDGHSSIHTGLKPHVCQICGKKFRLQGGLLEHRLTHEKTCRYSCDVCGKMFSHIQNLKVHTKLHNDIRDYVCSVCGKAFAQKQSLIRHERVHSGEKPFECLLCNKRFYDSTIIRKHMMLVHKKEPKRWREDTFTHEKQKKCTLVTDVV